MTIAILAVSFQSIWQTCICLVITVCSCFTWWPSHTLFILATWGTCANGPTRSTPVFFTRKPWVLRHHDWQLHNSFQAARQSDILVGGLRFYRNSVYYLLYSSHYPRTSLNGIQPKLATCSEVSAIWKCMSEIGVFHPPTNWGLKTTLFRQFHNLTAILVACLLNETRS